MLAGCYFDLVGQPGFAKAFGDSVEGLFGELIERSGELSPMKGLPYQTGDGVRHGADWILFDETANVFVECKAARIPLQAKVASSAADVEAGFSKLADAVVQNYKNIIDAISSKTHWVPNGCPNFSLIVTLEDWFLFSKIATETLAQMISDRLIEKGLPTGILKEIPYSIACAADLPALTQAMSLKGIEVVLREKSREYDGHLFSTYLKTLDLPENPKGNVFEEDYSSLVESYKERFGKTKGT